MMDDRTNSTQPEAGSEIAIVDERTIRDKIYIIRGVKVMLDFELAEIYGYETKNFNRQVRNNAAKFEGDDFMFRLTRDELKELSRCKNFTTIQTKGVKGGSPYLRQRLLSGGDQEPRGRWESQGGLCGAFRKDLFQIIVLHGCLPHEDIDAGIHGKAEQKA